MRTGILNAMTPTEQKNRLAEGVVFEKADNWQEARQFWTASRKLDPKVIKFFIREAAAAIRTQEPELASDALEKARALEVDVTFSEQLTKLEQKNRLVEGIALEKSGNWQAARQFWTASRKLDPKFTKYFMQEAAAAIRTQEPELAYEALKKARALDIDEVFSEQLTKLEQKNRLVEGIAIEKSGNWHEARKFWTASRKLDPKATGIFIREAVAAIRIQEPEFANEALKKARALDIDETFSEQLTKLEESADNLATSLLRIRGMEAFETGDFEVARINFENLSSANPNHPWAAARARVAAGLAPSFAERLKTERPKVVQRVFLTGCGRSGTWLLAAMLSGIESLRMAPGETPLGEFLNLPNEPEIHLVKRTHDAYQHFDRISSNIMVIHVVRHPFAVLISKHLEKSNYITLQRLEGEHRAFFSYLKDRQNTLVLKYEDVVGSPEIVQAEVEKFLGAKSKHPFRDFYMSVDLEQHVIDAMHGLRPLDESSLNQWKNKPGAQDALRQIIKESDGTLHRFATHFDYEMEI